MDSIKSKMLSLSQATAEATARALVYDDELRKNNEIADRFEEQVSFFSHNRVELMYLNNVIPLIYYLITL